MENPELQLKIIIINNCAIYVLIVNLNDDWLEKKSWFNLILLVVVIVI